MFRLRIVFVRCWIRFRVEGDLEGVAGRACGAVRSLAGPGNEGRGQVRTLAEPGATEGGAREREI